MATSMIAVRNIPYMFYQPHQADVFDRIDVCGLLQIIIPYMRWEDRFILAQTNRALRRIVHNVMHETEAFAYIAKIYNCYTEVFDTSYWENANARASAYSGAVREMVYEPNPRVLNIKNWLSALVRTERMYSRHGDLRPSVLPVAQQKWSMIPDEQLHDLVKHVKFLSYNFIMGSLRPHDDQYLFQVCRYTYCEPYSSFSLDNLLGALERKTFLTLCAGAHSRMWRRYGGRTSALDTCGGAELRVVYINRPGELAGMQLSGVPNRYCIERIAMQPFVTRAVGREHSLLNSRIAVSKSSPYVFTRWLTGVEIDPVVDPVLATQDATKLLSDNIDLLGLDPAVFWNWDLPCAATRDLGARPMTANANECSTNVTSKSLLEKKEIDGTTIKAAWARHWSYGMSLIRDHLGKVFAPFSVAEIMQITRECHDRDIHLVESNKGPNNIGAYLELSLTGAPMSTIARQEGGCPVICALYIGPKEAVLYQYHE